MGRHSLPDQYGAGAGTPRPRTRRRTIAVATTLVLTVAAGTAVALRTALLSCGTGTSCQDDAVRLKLAASPDMAPALRAAAPRAHDADVTSDGRCIGLSVTAHDSSSVADALLAGRRPDVQVWMPDADVCVQRVTADGRATQVTGTANVAATPIGVAVVPAAAMSLGRP